MQARALLHPRSPGSVPGRALPPRRPIVYAALRGILRPVFRVYFRMRGEGLEHLPQDGPFLVAPNHVSMLDWAHLAYFLPRSVRFVIDQEMLERLPIRVGCAINGMIAVRTDRPDVRGLRLARAALAGGIPLVVFPEGQISRTGRPQRARPGVISLAAHCQVPIVPAALRGAFAAFPRWQRVPRPRPVTVVFGAPLPPPPRRIPRAGQQELADRLMAHITALLDGTVPPPAPRGIDAA